MLKLLTVDYPVMGIFFITWTLIVVYCVVSWVKNRCLASYYNNVEKRK